MSSANFFLNGISVKTIAPIAIMPSRSHPLPLRLWFSIKYQAFEIKSFHSFCVIVPLLLCMLTFPHGNLSPIVVSAGLSYGNFFLQNFHIFWLILVILDTLWWHIAVRQPLWKLWSLLKGHLCRTKNPYFPLARRPPRSADHPLFVGCTVRDVWIETLYRNKKYSKNTAP